MVELASDVINNKQNAPAKLNGKMENNITTKKLNKKKKIKKSKDEMNEVEKKRSLSNSQEELKLSGEPPAKKIKEEDGKPKIAKTKKKSSERKQSLTNKETETVNSDGTATVVEEESPEEKGDFKKFNISQKTISMLKKKNVTYLFPIQIKTFDHVFNGKDVIAQARTGTGKTFAFAIPLVEKLLKTEAQLAYGRKPKVLVLAPTRELVIQINNDFNYILQKHRSICIYGGSSYLPQIQAMRDGVDIVVGTPGRIMDHVEKGNLQLNEINHVVLDEVDQMLDMGFSEIVEEILSHAYTSDRTEKPQTLLFSATCPPWVKRTSAKYMRPENTVHVDTIGTSSVRTATTVEHLSIQCNDSELNACLGDVVQLYSGKHGRALVFTNTKLQANELILCKSMQVMKAQVLHGDIEQKQREITLKAFRNGTINCLVATDVAARGLDIPEVDLVVQISPPQDIESYIHRSGRTGRAGRNGVSICFYKPNQSSGLQKVERTAGIKFKRIGPPQPDELVKSSCRDAMTSIQSINKKLIKQFMDAAESVASEFEGGAVEALAGAIAFVSGATSLPCRSLINSTANRRTWHFKSNTPIMASSVYSQVANQLGPEIRNMVSNLRLTVDGKEAVFDLPDEWTTEVEDNWKDNYGRSLRKAETLPQLKEAERKSYFGGWANTNYDGRDNFGSRFSRNRNRGNNRGGGGFQRRGGGGGGRGNRGRGSFNNPKAYERRRAGYL